ncbi:hypothetical protein BEH94_11730 [Candidatus Altiarchaeales archaeon WOR_SM1_SCG]|nr:hypothetical protein BEH94_11730 [Candidatus Altiarchaeales archaeon WOR_SM1_SCG]
MKPDSHKAKADEIKESLNKLLPDSGGKNVVAVVELSYGIALHLIAYGMQIRHNKHLDTHVGLPKYLRGADEDEIASLFEHLDTLRHGRWYGGRGNGDVVKECLKIIDKIERLIKE